MKNQEKQKAVLNAPILTANTKKHSGEKYTHKNLVVIPLYAKTATHLSQKKYEVGGKLSNY